MFIYIPGLLSWDTKETDCDLKHMEDVCRKINANTDLTDNGNTFCFKNFNLISFIGRQRNEEEENFE